jgi:hypothetical protein
VTDDDEMAMGEIEDLRPPDYWGRHPLTKVVLFCALGVGIAGARFVDGDGGTLLMGGAGLVVWPMVLVAALDHMRGLVSPLPGRDMKLLSPIAGITWATGFIVLSVMALSSVACGDTEGERPSWFLALGVMGVGLLIVGVMIQIGSLSDQWPDTWRPPYARPQPPGASSADPEPAEHTRADERP